MRTMLFRTSSLRVALMVLAFSMLVNAQRNPSPKAQSSKVQTSSNTGTNAAASLPPVVTKNADEPARQPFASAISYIWDDGSAVVQESFVVPAHKRLVIEFLSATTAYKLIRKLAISVSL